MGRPNSKNVTLNSFLSLREYNREIIFVTWQTTKTANHVTISYAKTSLSRGSKPASMIVNETALDQLDRRKISEASSISMLLQIHEGK